MLLYNVTFFPSYLLCSACLPQAPVFCQRTIFSPCSVATFCPQHIPSLDTDLRLPWLHTTASRKGKYCQGCWRRLLILPQQWWTYRNLYQRGIIQGSSQIILVSELGLIESWIKWINVIRITIKNGLLWHDCSFRKISRQDNFHIWLKLLVWVAQFLFFFLGDREEFHKYHKKK